MQARHQNNYKYYTRVRNGSASTGGGLYLKKKKTI